MAGGLGCCVWRFDRLCIGVVFTLDWSLRLVCVIHEATKRKERKSIFTAPNPPAGPPANLAGCLFDARRKSGVTSRQILLGTFLARQRATLLRLLVNLLCHFVTYERLCASNDRKNALAMARNRNADFYRADSWC